MKTKKKHAFLGIKGSFLESNKLQELAKEETLQTCGGSLTFDTIGVVMALAIAVAYVTMNKKDASVETTENVSLKAIQNRITATIKHYNQFQ